MGGGEGGRGVGAGRLMIRSLREWPLSESERWAPYELEIESAAAAISVSLSFQVFLIIVPFGLAKDGRMMEVAVLHFNS